METRMTQRKNIKGNVLTVLTLADLVEAVKENSGLTEVRRHNVASSIRRFAAALDLNLAVTPASFPLFRQAIRRFHPADADLTNKRWSTIKSDVAFALRRYGAPSRAPLPRDLTPRWRALQNAIKDVRLKRGLSRFMHYCSFRAIEPDKVSDEASEDFVAYLRERTFVKKPERIHRSTCVLWNRAAKVVPGWPPRHLSEPTYRRLIRIPWKEFPVSFIEEVGRLERHWSAQSVLDGDPDAPVLAEPTRYFRQQGIRRCASALVHSGFPIENLTSLARLVEPANVRRALEYYLDWLGGPRPSLVEMVDGIVAVARFWVRLGEDDLAELRRMKRNLARHVSPRRLHPSPKNAERLRQFDDVGRQAALLGLPRKLVRLARKRGLSNKAALIFQTALAIEIELKAPIRLKNLVGLRVGEHILFSRSERKGAVHLVIPAEEVKGGRIPIELELRGEIVKLFEHYLETYRPLLGRDDGYVFPGACAGHKHEVTLSGQIVNAIDRHAGLRMNVHLFRHLAAKLYLDDNPGDYVTVQRLLGHASVDTTIAFYAGFSTASAFRAYDEVITNRRRRLGLPPGESLE